MIKKIGILTFHRSVNNGALIQAYSLSKRMQQDFSNFKIEIIDYYMPKAKRLIYPETLTEYFSDLSIKKNISRSLKLIKNPQLLKINREKADSFKSIYKYLPLSNRYIYSDDSYELFDYINNNYDIVVAGSDAIWNYNVRGFPNPYFLSDLILIPKFSYAASCYGMNYEKLSQEEKININKILTTYQFLGTRDIESEKFLNDIGCEKKPVHTCDPTVFLNVNDLPVDREQFEKKIKCKGFDFHRESIGVMLPENMLKWIKQKFQGKYQIVSLFNYSRMADVNLYDLNPFEWAYIFRYFKITFTTYFHGMLLSLRNGTPVICFAINDNFSKNHIAKIPDFLERIGFEKSYFKFNKINWNNEELENEINKCLNYDRKEDIISRMEIESKSYYLFKEKIEKVICNLS